MSQAVSGRPGFESRHSDSRIQLSNLDSAMWTFLENTVTLGE